MLKPVPPKSAQRQKQESYIRRHRRLVILLGFVFVAALIVIALIAAGVIDIGLGGGASQGATNVDGDNSNLLTIVISAVAGVLGLALIVGAAMRWRAKGSASAESALEQLRALAKKSKSMTEAELTKFKELWSSHAAEIKDKQLASEEEISEFESIGENKTAK
jgi:Flp pilus assembly protein TadB